MVQFKLDETLKRLQVSQYWLSKHTGIADNAISKIYKNTSTQIKLDTLNKIIEALKEVDSNIKLEDVIQYVDDEN